MWPASLYPFLTPTFFFALVPSLLSALPSTPQPSLLLPNLATSNKPIPIPLILNLTLPSAYEAIDCFHASTELTYPLDPNDCDHAIELLFHDPSGVMTKQTFSYHSEAGGFGTPADWHDGRCQILLTSGLQHAVDEFRLVDVIVAAQAIIKECVPKSKTSRGGVTFVGNMKGFFVAVNGPEPATSGAGNRLSGDSFRNGTGAWWEAIEGEMDSMRTSS